MDSRFLIAAGVAAMVLTGCETTPTLDYSTLEAKVQTVEDDDFGQCILQSREATNNLITAKQHLTSLQGGSGSQSDLDKGNAAADLAAEHKGRAGAACAALYQPIEQRAIEIEVDVADHEARLTKLERAREIVRGVTFESGSSTLTSQARTVLDIVANRLTREPRRVEVAGHASAIGSNDLNQRLSEARAQSVRNYLISRGVDADIVTARGYGVAEPIATNDTPQGRQANQRIELRFEE